jgi:hypothetical protein
MKLKLNRSRTLTLFFVNSIELWSFKVLEFINRLIEKSDNFEALWLVNFQVFFEICTRFGVFGWEIPLRLWMRSGFGVNLDLWLG